jgi:hypothetical protein
MSSRKILTIYDNDETDMTEIRGEQGMNNVHAWRVIDALLAGLVMWDEHFDTNLRVALEGALKKGRVVPAKEVQS